MKITTKVKRISFFVLFFLVITTMRPAFAQAPSSTAPTTTQAPTLKQGSEQLIYGNMESNVPRNLHTLTQSVFIETLSSVVCMLSGHDLSNPKGSCLTLNPKSGKIAYATDQNGKNGIGKFMGGLIASTTSIPVSGTDYIAYSLDNFGLVKHTYAAGAQNGVGYSRLSPLMGVWVRFRDIAYLFFVLAFTVIGLAIMFRVKIDARTVMTIQNQIPKIVIALIMVTFSYAIAGFLIDLMYVATYFIILVFSSLTPTHVNVDSSVFGVFNKVFGSRLNVTPQTFGVVIPTPNYISYNVGGSGILSLTTTISQSVTSVFSSLTSDFIDSLMGHWYFQLFSIFGVLDLGCKGTGAVLHAITFGHYDAPSCNFAEEYARDVIGFVFTALAYIIVLVAILFTLFRVWFVLIKSFAYVLVDAMIGPLWIAAGIFPGSKLSFTTWIRHLMGHLSVFPMTFAVIFLGKTMMDALMTGDGSLLFSPPLVGAAIGGNTAIAGFIGFGFIISLPTILDKTKKAVGAMDFGLKDIKAATVFGANAPVSTAKQIVGLKARAKEVVATEFDKNTGTPIYGKRGYISAITNVFGRR